MSYHFFYRKLNDTAQRMFPGLAEVPLPAWDHLISPLEVRLPKKIYQRAESAIRALHQVTRRPAYAQAIEPVEGITDVATANESVLMAYDFHTNEQGECFLVEINTNASGFMLGSVMQAAHQPDGVTTPPATDQLWQAFAEEMKAWGRASSPPTVVITDEDMATQKMRPEFLMYRDWFRAGGWKADLCESRDFTQAQGHLQAPVLGRVDLVYNRLTDFYLESPQHLVLRSAFASQEACFSPNPREYWLLADKQRLIDFCAPDFLEQAGATTEECAAIRQVLIPTFEKSAYPTPDAIWSERKHLFFKPKRSFGGKSVYRGESVSRKVFERLMNEDVLIQHFCPPQKMPTDDPRSVLSNWKFDLRFFVYRDQIQLVAARIYQGQVTNFSSPLGGFTLVEFA